MNEAQRRDRIERAIEDTLSVRDEEKWRIPFAVTELVSITQPSQMSPQQLKGVQRSFRCVAIEATRRELSKIKNIDGGDLSDLARRTAELHAPAIALLADEGWFREPNVAWAKSAADRALLNLQARPWRFGKPPSKKQPNNRANSISLVVTRIYENLTGEKVALSRYSSRSRNAGKPAGPFYRFLSEIFHVAGVKASAEAVTKKIKKSRRAK